MHAVLTIAIPTYNRPHRVAERVQELLPQCRDLEEVEILVLDNASDEDVESRILHEIPSVRGRVSFHRNVANVGLAANICRCYEIAGGTWVWTLGDDDSVEPDAVGKILAILRRHQVDPPGGVNFSTGIHTYDFEERFSELDEYCKMMKIPEAFSNALFISSCVFRRDVFLKYLRCAYINVASAAPQIAVPVQALIEGISFGVSPEKIVRWVLPDPAERWNGLMVAKSLPLLGDIGDCHPALAAFAAGFRIHMPGDLQLKLAAKRIFGSEGFRPIIGVFTTVVLLLL